MSKTYEPLYFTTSPKHRSNEEGFTTSEQKEECALELLRRANSLSEGVKELVCCITSDMSSQEKRSRLLEARRKCMQYKIPETEALKVLQEEDWLI